LRPKKKVRRRAACVTLHRALTGGYKEKRKQTIMAKEDEGERVGTRQGGSEGHRPPNLRNWVKLKEQGAAMIIRRQGQTEETLPKVSVSQEGRAAK